MPLFSYKAQNSKNEIVEDTIQATSHSDAVEALNSIGMKILTLRSLNSSLSGSSRGRISLSEKSTFCRFMATMIHSGLSVPEALEIIRAEAKKGKMKRVLADLVFQTQKGKNLTTVLSQYKEDFDPIFLTMIKVGEESGTLEKSFTYLSKQLASSHELMQKIKGAMMYPAIIVVAMLGNGFVMAVFVLPRIANVFLKLDFPLPLPTKIILNIGNFIGENTAVSILGMVVGAILLGLTFYFRKTRSIFMKVFQKFPLVKGVTKQIDVARFARTLSTLLKSGVPITSALDVASDGLLDEYLKKEAKKFSEGVAKGESLSQVLAKSKSSFPAIMIQTIKAGEKTGSLDEVLDDMATFYESEVEYSLKRSTALLEPVLMLFIGIVVGAMVIIMIAPIYGIIGGLQQQIGN